MSTHAIENLSFTELKEHRDALIADAEKLPPAELAARYVQARTDAKQRDEKLAEQGTTIASLNSALAESMARACGHAEEGNRLAAELAQSKANHAASQEAAADCMAKMQKQNDATNAELEATKAALAASEKLATQRRAALADVMAFAGGLSAKVAPLLAAE